MWSRDRLLQRHWVRGCYLVTGTGFSFIFLSGIFDTSLFLVTYSSSTGYCFFCLFSIVYFSFSNTTWSFNHLQWNSTTCSSFYSQGIRLLKVLQDTLRIRFMEVYILDFFLFILFFSAFNLFVLVGLNFCSLFCYARTLLYNVSFMKSHKRRKSTVITTEGIRTINMFTHKTTSCFFKCGFIKPCVVQAEDQEDVLAMTLLPLWGLVAPVAHCYCAAPTRNGWLRGRT